MSVDRGRERGIAYRSAWGWPVRSPLHAVAVVAVVVGLVLAVNGLASSAAETRVIAGEPRPGPIIVGRDSPRGDTTPRTTPWDTEHVPARDVIPVPETWNVAPAPEPAAAPAAPPAQAAVPPAQAAAPPPAAASAPGVIPMPDTPMPGEVRIPAELPLPAALPNPAELPLPEQLPLPLPEQLPAPMPEPEQLPAPPPLPEQLPPAPPPAPPAPPAPPPPVPEVPDPDAFAAAEARNVAKSEERARVTALPEVAERLAALAEWEERGLGVREPVHFTTRSGALLSGHVWAGRDGPPVRPLVVVTSGGGRAQESDYWWAAHTLTAAGYVVLTWDAQGQGASERWGADPNLGAVASAGLSQLTGETFFDGTQDAIDFATSTPERPYCPRASRSGVDHCPLQERDVASGAATPFNPLWQLVDPAAKVGLAGHSYGASGASWVAQADERVGAVVAWDALCDPTLAPVSLLDSGAIGDGLAEQAMSPACLTGGQAPAPALRTPALGISGDYLFEPVPLPTPPDSALKAAASQAYSLAGVDTGQIVIRGGTHEEFANDPAPGSGATMRGLDIAAWYTTAWFDKYLRGDPTADARLLSTRWQADPAGAEIDEAGDGNLFSTHYASRLDIHAVTTGARWACDDLRNGCPGMLAADTRPPRYSYLDLAGP